MEGICASKVNEKKFKRLWHQEIMSPKNFSLCHNNDLEPRSPKLVFSLIKKLAYFDARMLIIQSALTF